jgi:hypothetical protein
MLRRVVAELLSVAERRLGLARDPTTSLPRLDDGRYVVGVPVDGHTAVTLAPSHRARVAGSAATLFGQKSLCLTLSGILPNGGRHALVF